MKKAERVIMNLSKLSNLNEDERKITSLLDAIEDDLYEAIRKAKLLIKELGDFDRKSKEINSYFIPWITRFIEDQNQPGSLRSIRKDIEK